VRVDGQMLIVAAILGESFKPWMYRSENHRHSLEIVDRDYLRKYRELSNLPYLEAEFFWKPTEGMECRVVHRKELHNN
jgi:hypothetical protein